MVNCEQGPWERRSTGQSLAPSTAPKARPRGTAQPETELGAPPLPVLIVPVNWQLMLCTQSSATAQLGDVRHSLPQLQDKPQLCPLPPVLAHPYTAARSTIWEPERPIPLAQSPGACFLPFQTRSPSSSSLGLLCLAALFLTAAPLNLNISSANLN